MADLTLVVADTYLADGMASAVERGRPWARDTQKHHVDQLRAFAGHAAMLAGLPSNPLASFAGPRRVTRVDRSGDGLDDAEMLAVLRGLDPGTLGGVVDLALVATGYEDGPRTSEYARADVEDVRVLVVNGQVLGPVLVIRHPAKGGPQRILPLGVRAEDAMRLVIGRRVSGPLFPSRRGDYLSEDAIRDRLGRVGKRVGIALTPQRLRRSASSWQGTYGASSGHLETVFGWAPNPGDVKSGHYVKPTPAQLLYAHQTRLSPLDRLELRVGTLPFV
jgi:integrase